MLLNVMPPATWSGLGGESDTSTATAWGNAITVDNKRHVYITGEFTGGNMKFDTAQLWNQGWHDGFIAKLDTGGNLIWAKEFGGILSDRGYGIATDTTADIYVTGHYGSTVFFDNLSRTAVYGMDIFAAKLNPNDDFLWVTSMGGVGDDYGQQITVDPAGNVFSISLYEEDATFGNFLLSGAFWTTGIVRFNSADGDVIWAKGIGGATANCFAKGTVMPGWITTDNFGNVIAAIAYQWIVDANPSTNAADTFFLGACDGDGGTLIVKLDTTVDFYGPKPRPVT